jgi:glycosyltransferase 2 family protein
LTEHEIRGGWARKRPWLIAVAALGVLLYLGVAFWVDAPRLLAALARLGWWGAAAVLALSFVSYLQRFQRWHLYILRFGHSLPAPRHLLIYLSGFAFTLSPGKAGEVIRSWYLREHGISYAESLAAFFVERMLDVLAMVLLAALIVADHPAYRGLIGGALLIVILVILGVGRPEIPTWLDSFAARRHGRIASGAAGIGRLLRSSTRLLSVWPLTWGVALGVLAWSTLGMGFYLICQGLHITLSPLAAVGIYATAVLAGNAAIFLPGGIGGTEVVMVTLLRETGASLQSAVIAALLCSLASLWFAVLVGIAAASLVELAQGDRIKSNNKI